MECDHNEMGGAEMSLRSKLAVMGLTATLAPFGAQAGESVTYTVDGADYEGYSAPAEGSAKGLVLIIHDWDGLTGYEEKRAEMLAELGYDAFAIDLFGKGNRPAEVAAPQAAKTGRASWWEGVGQYGCIAGG